MKLTLTQPTDATLTAFLESATGPLSYPEVGATHDAAQVSGYDNDFNKVCLGEGAEVFQRACAAIRRWEHFPKHWVKIGPGTPAIHEGQKVAMQARAFGLYWISAAQIVYTIEKPRRFGFAYGTLDAHVECGEERFLIEWLPDNTVWYRLTAFSRPRRWFIRLGYPLARHLQKRFVKDSSAILQNWVKSGHVEEDCDDRRGERRFL
ncbi:DUF1990 domain-containing protein [Armatimonas sp.]|uniref:DUF1990 family protein n=1 Tax=Armatimonas sp. TaxID=1872638 RepID=UPI00286BA9AC|nr:DUF1990 domain-containing protein [Armatimonas sp.]